MKCSWSLSMAGILFACSSVASAGTITISDTDFGNPALVGVANGTYVAGSPGYMHLAFSASDDAVVGAKGPFGVLSSRNMSFTYSNLVAPAGFAPYAAFGVSSNGLWNLSGQEYLVIALSGSQIDETTGIHVFDVNTGLDAGVVWGTQLADILGMAAPSGGLTYGNFEVMRAYAYIGDWPGVGSASVDINSISVTDVPEPTTLLLAGSALFGLLGFGKSNRRPRMASIDGGGTNRGLCKS